MKTMIASGQRWGIVLAGGEGERLREMTARWYGRPRPKQYCAFTGGRTMFEHTMDRAISVVPAERVVSVIGRGHVPYVTGRGAGPMPGWLLEQPRNCDTGPGIFLALATVLAYDSAATVAVFPSDHFISQREAFRGSLLAALDLAEAWEERLVLLGAVPSRPETEYGWIRGGDERISCGGPWARGVARFVEKPEARQAEQLLREGCLWNTMIMAFKARALWNAGWELHPSLMRRFELLRDAVGGPREAHVLAAIYEDMPPMNFSREILARCFQKAMLLPMRGVAWCDWGSPERVLETLERIGARAPWQVPAAPSFPAPRPGVALPVLAAGHLSGYQSVLPGVP